MAIKPRRAKNLDKSTEEGRNRTILFLRTGSYKLVPRYARSCRELITTLGIKASRFDPWQTIEVTQELIKSTGGDIGEIPYSNPEQFRRARLYKRMLENNYLTLLPNPVRDRELRRLEQISDYKVDHPKGAGESKDLFDVEAACVDRGETPRQPYEMLFM